MLDVKIIDQPDGSAIATLHFKSQETLLAFAQIGFLHILETKANEVVAEQGELVAALKAAKKKKIKAKTEKAKKPKSWRAKFNADVRKKRKNAGA